MHDAQTTQKILVGKHQSEPSLDPSGAFGEQPRPRTAPSRQRTSGQPDGQCNELPNMLNQELLPTLGDRIEGSVFRV